MNELRDQIQFIVEVDKLKEVYRKSYLIDKSRNENDAEHSWHISLMAVILFQYAEKGVDLLHVLKMLLIHDIVEIDAGDTFAYDEVGYKDKEEREQKAAKRIFGLLPDSQRQSFIDLWYEYEEQFTKESKFAAALDRMQPLLQNYYTEGSSWKQFGITKSQVLKRNRGIKDASDGLWAYVTELIDDAVRLGYLKE
jgi:putative hydrolase of HD superfamily